MEQHQIGFTEAELILTWRGVLIQINGRRSIEDLTSKDPPDKQDKEHEKTPG